MSRAGFTVALIGPDGAGKTTIARRLPGRLTRPCSYIYMGVAVESSSHLLPTTRVIEALKERRRGSRRATGPAAGPPAKDGDARRDDGSAASPSAASPSVASPSPGRAGRTGSRTSARPGWIRSSARSVASALKLTNRLAEEWYRQAIVWRERRRGRIVVMDRHFFIDYHAADVVAADRTIRRRIHGWVLEHLYPRPDLVLYLDAPAEVLLARKGEGTLESLERRRRDYFQVGGLVPTFEVVDATRPLESVVEDVVRRIEDYPA
jgi:thymidylate kinase